ncbi:RNA-binding domain superfamily [Sesbania bispinosa]|nr:RNA-binding domain superfamily [Sesbania bispinosa]
MGSSADEYAAFEEKVRRTVYFDNMSPQVTESVMRTAFAQFATVISIKFIPNYLGPGYLPRCALVELDSEKKAKEVITMTRQYPFMMAGMPRPVRARPAVMEMFDDRPMNPNNRKIECRWLDPSDPDFKVAKELKKLTQKQTAEIAFMHQLQLEEENKLAAQQQDTIKVHYKKFKMIHDIMADGTAPRLARGYNMHVADK